MATRPKLFWTGRLEGTTSALVERLQLGHLSHAGSPMTMLDDVLDVETVGPMRSLFETVFRP
jgi:hypothetical protein